MAFLELKNIGKIYAGEGNVAVGIRGVNLSFEKGEFVAVTGESGSGKSTLLNVISSMDTYEEGEMLIEGEPTSHYLEPDREAYREKYISFIFQDYNILESFTVLQNVELALFTIEDPKLRRERALALLRRVGLEKQLHQHGSQLSGGQKQRTVIARALAKDSPIILADEPTGNLDSESAQEIVALLKEVSRDRLVIVVTHSFEEVAQAATREIRVYNGAVREDHLIRQPEIVTGETTEKPAEGSGKSRIFENGLSLGKALFTAKPKLSLFLGLLFIIGALGMLLVTSDCAAVPKLLGKSTMFSPIKGRLVVARRDGSPMTEEEVEKLREETKAQRSIHYDYLLDGFNKIYVSGDYLDVYSEEDTYVPGQDIFIHLTPAEAFDPGKKIGRLPSAPQEVFLYLPIYLRDQFGKNDIQVPVITWCDLELQVVGLAYYYDNNQPARILFNEEGFRNAGVAWYLYCCNYFRNTNISFNQIQSGEFNTIKNLSGCLIPNYDVPEGKVYVSDELVREALTKSQNKKKDTLQVSYDVTGTVNATNAFDRRLYMTGTIPLDAILTESEKPIGANTSYTAYRESFVAVHPATLTKLFEERLSQTYRQASLFFENDARAKEAVTALERDYTAALSSSSYSPGLEVTIFNTISGVWLIVMWVLCVIFLAFFINLCSGKAIGAFRHDLAILRSMGIPVRTIVVGLFTRLYLSLIPAFIFVGIVALLIFTSPKGNALFSYLYWWQYLLVFLGLFLIATRVGKKQVKKLFGQSVKEALRGGETA